MIISFESLNNSEFQTLEKSEMKAVIGGEVKSVCRSSTDCGQDTSVSTTYDVGRTTVSDCEVHDTPFIF